MVATIQQLEQVAKDLSAVASVYFFDNQILFLGCLANRKLVILPPCLYVCLKKRLTDKLVNYFFFCHWLTVSSFHWHGLRANDSCHWYTLGGRLICSHECRIIAVGMKRRAHNVLTTRLLFYRVTLASAGSTIEDLLKRFGFRCINYWFLYIFRTSISLKIIQIAKSYEPKCGVFPLLIFIQSYFICRFWQ